MGYLLGAVLAIAAGFVVRRLLKAEWFPAKQQWEYVSWLLIRGGNLALLGVICLAYSDLEDGLGLLIFLVLALVSLPLRKRPVVLTVMTPVVFVVLLGASLRSYVPLPAKPEEAVWKPRTAVGRSLHTEYSADLLAIAREFPPSPVGSDLTLIEISSSSPTEEPDKHQ